MPRSGDLYTHEHTTYVVLSTPLGWIAFDPSTLTCFGVPCKDVNDTVDGLKPTGLCLNLKRSKMVDLDIDEGEE